MRIAVLLATFNRKDKTLSCLRSLYDQQLPSDITFKVFHTDDNSTDGTREAVKLSFPDVEILHGSGSLFWAGGMRNSWGAAVKEGFDYYLLLNDDTILLPHTVASLLDHVKAYGNGTDAVVIGSTMDKDKEVISYGGQRLYAQDKVQYYSVFSKTEAMECDMANANIMLVPDKVVKTIGILSGDYTHSIADFDYTLRAKKAGFKNIVVPGVSGYCVDDHGNNWRSGRVPLRERIKYLKSPKGLAYYEYLHFIRQHFPKHLPVAFVKLWAKTLMPVLWDKFKVSNA
ncbi:glycosyltransferase family 2 protein [Mucilaginibacter sp. RS28]|uniref:Glycosyltransferase family 2 protein n=1 Tax=Mucilaginibacter straminoryzae TaxID=2932774 RepID=A0A9X1X4Y9_9SPHI|nr:glycosyltransferase family 2 protein [Mucilaginibacter straminoryzae]MCJ8211028.1 glycosyltransferase family 2 protein [Mucilaginibacter straminoryzae]